MNFNLTKHEAKYFDSIQMLKPDDLDCHVREDSEVLILNFKSNSNQYCPFQLVFGRGDSINHLTFYFGDEDLGVEFVTFENFSEPEVAKDLNHDILAFLQSTITVHSFHRKDKIKKAIYDVSQMSEKYGEFEYNPSILPSFFKLEKKVKTYQAWL